ncbi:hypothetical protein AGMMS49965_19760 [Bacteroidia bacterium]|nr:hypothetical protein AGMMS49965_19760 [Bacteroidia bacterium]
MENIEEQVEALVQRAYAYLMAGNIDLAFADFNEAVRVDPGNPLVYDMRARGYIVKSEYEKAITDCNKAIQLEPDFALFYSTRASAYQNCDWEKAFADHNKAVELDPDNAEVLNQRALAFSLKGDIQSANADISRAMQLDPSLADRYAHSGKLMEGIAQSLGTDANDPSVKYLVFTTHAQDYINKANWDALIAESAEALKLNVSDAASAFAYAYMGVGYAGKEDWDKAITNFTKAIGLDPKGQAGYMSYNGRGLAYLQNEDIRVIDDWEAALKIIDDPELKEQLAELKQAIGM